GCLRPADRPYRATQYILAPGAEEPPRVPRNRSVCGVATGYDSTRRHAIGQTRGAAKRPNRSWAAPSARRAWRGTAGLSGCQINPADTPRGHPARRDARPPYGALPGAAEHAHGA